MDVFPTKRFVSLSAAVVLGFSGVAASAPAVFAKETAALSGSAFAEQGKKLAQDPKVQGYATDGNGNVVVFKLKDEKLDGEAQEFVSGHKNVKVVELAKPLSAFSGGQVVGGHPIINYSPEFKTAGACSVGFSMLSTEFKAQIATAGHCTIGGPDEDNLAPGRATDLIWADPTGSPAATGADSQEKPSSLAAGKLLNWRFGAPGQMAPDEQAPVSTDELPNGEKYLDYSEYELSTYESLVPAVSKWNNPADLVDGSTPVTGVAEPVQGEEVTRSGRTTGSKSGEVLYADGWFNIEGRLIEGFGGYIDGAPGDSGGSVINTKGEAIGLTSGGGEDANGDLFVWFSGLKNDLDQYGNKSRVLVAKAPKMEGVSATSAGFSGTVAPKPSAVEMPAGGAIKGTGAEGFDSAVFLTAAGEQIKGSVNGDSWSISLPGNAGASVSGRVLLTNKYEVSSELALNVSITAAESTPAPEPTATSDPTTTPAPDPTTSAPAPTSSAPAPKPTATQKPTEEAKPALTVDPERIAVSKFKGDGENDEKVGVTYLASGLEPNSSVTFETSKGGQVVRTTTVTADKNGNASVRVWGLASSPADQLLGEYEVVAKTSTGDLTGSFTVVADEKAEGGNDKKPEGDNGKELPRTGNDTLPAVGAALGMIALGGGLVAAARRRKA